MAKEKAERVMDHFWVDDSGAHVDSIDKATGHKSVGRGPAKEVVIHYPAKGKGLMACALFGSRTKLINTASGKRNGKELGEAEQFAAMRNLIASIDAGQFNLDREGGGIFWDYKVLVQSFWLVSLAARKVKASDEAQRVAWLTAQCEQGKEADGTIPADSAGAKFAASLRTVPGVEQKYRELTGKYTGSVDDIWAQAAPDAVPAK